jgi:uncharacterized membrane protein YphA (DoxX/SURF4 family)
MKIAVVIVRVLIGLLFLFASFTYFLNLAPPPELNGNARIFMDGVAASGYILPIVKTLELVCGLAFITGRFVALAIVLIFPIVVNILMINVLLIPSGLPIALLILAGILFLAYAHRKNYESLLSVN